LIWQRYNLSSSSSPREPLLLSHSPLNHGPYISPEASIETKGEIERKKVIFVQKQRILFFQEKKRESFLSFLGLKKKVGNESLKTTPPFRPPHTERESFDFHFISKRETRIFVRVQHSHISFLFKRIFFFFCWPDTFRPVHWSGIFSLSCPISK
jgi:hypothetical protein